LSGLSYLIPFVIATAIYFGGKVPGIVGDFLTGALPWVLAFAVEMQTYTSVRKLAVIWNGLKAPALEDYQREQMKKEMWAQIVTVAFLSGLSVWNQASYLAMTWNPTESAFGAPRWLEIAIRSLGPAVFFFLTAFGAPLAKTIGEKLGEEAHKTLEAFLGVLTRQRKRAIKKIDGEMLDMSEAINNVAAAANERKSGTVLASIQSTITRLANGQSGAPAAPTPVRASRRGSPLLEECRLVWRRGMTPQELAARVGCSDKTARRHINTLMAELDEPVPLCRR
jgi:uncharacterized membrane protein YhdT